MNSVNELVDSFAEYAQSKIEELGLKIHTKRTDTTFQFTSKNLPFTYFSCWFLKYYVEISIREQGKEISDDEYYACMATSKEELYRVFDLWVNFVDETVRGVSE